MLEVKNLDKSYQKDLPALSDISFSVKPGTFVAIIGPSGAGKTTILRSLNQLIKDDSGEILIDGDDIRSANKAQLRKHRRQIGMVFQNYNLVERLTVIENVLHGRLGYKSTLAGVLGRYTKEEKEEAMSLLEKVGLEDFALQRCSELSGGQKQRVGIARSLIQHPKVILCDEPIASLDPASAQTVMQLLKDLTDEYNLICVANLHQINMAKKYADQIIGIRKGHLVFDEAADLLSEDILRTLYDQKITKEFE
ncbi:phosphonate ABC transporter ATP-binding protein [Companilactobacillus alimentarius]|uniref:Phosphonate ABC transporter ATP-binding protein n=1 Tax=Companilactobacillus alimentarius DSM 20249 TaxID=1423720 RepID=A0A2K9HJC7_9LACO|nr:phosphonate ABC transporter ATP-binding protein [Companilactobacillus alimentarius]AUI72644.1 phosphonate ABC transporter ATP-binding protein [Companilactobacillus alimentarius DSM 20249]KRK75668.1 phosphonates ABC transporter, ATP-binding protein [Companilactobacillus alimentarius DSM 20249]MDT6952194.1 phosphonate ABC transporter ATP-binding protein [Companilactobacillus alimentarius]GEO45433.1 phosphonates import ATP-binding protein PhnC [Companilactobacillus alimentarius]